MIRTPVYLSAISCMVAVAIYCAAPQITLPTDPHTWSQEQFEAEIAAAAQACRPVQLPARVILTTTVDLKRTSGLTIRGNGRLFGYPSGQPKQSAAQIIWRGPPDEPMIRTAGIGLVFESVAFVFENPATAAVHVVNSQGIAGGGKHVFRDCSFVERKDHARQSVAILCGVNPRDHHCDALVIQSCIAVDCRALLETRNDSSVGHMLFGNHTAGCDAVIDAKAGGKISVFGHASVIDRVLLRITRAGSNVNDFTIAGLSVDAQAPSDFLLIDNALNRRSAVRISGKISGPVPRTRADLICNDQPTFDLTALAWLEAAQ